MRHIACPSETGGTGASRGPFSENSSRGLFPKTVEIVEIYSYTVKMSYIFIEIYNSILPDLKTGDSIISDLTTGEAL